MYCDIHILSQMYYNMCYSMFVQLLGVTGQSSKCACRRCFLQFISFANRMVAPNPRQFLPLDHELRTDTETFGSVCTTPPPELKTVHNYFRRYSGTMDLINTGRHIDDSLAHSHGMKHSSILRGLTGYEEDKDHPTDIMHLVSNWASCHRGTIAT